MDKINENLVLDRTTGQIKIHQTEDSLGMRKVGKLAAAGGEQEHHRTLLAEPVDVFLHGVVVDRAVFVKTDIERYDRSFQAFQYLRRSVHVQASSSFRV